MVLRVSGNLGSGKTTLCKRLASELNYQYIYSGGFLRKMARERNTAIEDFLIFLEACPVIEYAMDERQKILMNSTDNLVVDGRIAPFCHVRLRH